MKRISHILIVASAILSTESHAKTSTSFNGLSLGLQGGYSLANTKVSRTKVSSIAAVNTIKDRNDVAVDGTIGGAHIQYGHLFQNSFFVGLQLNSIFSNLKGKTETTVNFGEPIVTSAKMKNSYGAALKFGKVFDDMLPYLKLGVVTSKWTSKTEIPLVGSGGNNKHRLGVEMGLGCDYSFNDRFSTGVEVSRIHYQTFRYNVLSDRGVKRLVVQIKPRENRTMWHVKFKLLNGFKN